MDNLTSVLQNLLVKFDKDSWKHSRVITLPTPSRAVPCRNNETDQWKCSIFVTTSSRSWTVICKICCCELVLYFSKTTVFQLLIDEIIQCDTKYKFCSNLSSIRWILTIFCDLNLWPFKIFTSQETYLKGSVPVGYVWWSRWRIATCWKLTNIQNNWPDQQIQLRIFDFQVTRRHFSNDTSCNKLCCICFHLIFCLIL